MNDIIDKLTLKRMFSAIRKASSNITDIKVNNKSTLTAKKFVHRAKINGVNINFIDQYWHNPSITLKNGLTLTPKSINYKWVESYNNKITTSIDQVFLPVDTENNKLSHIELTISHSDMCILYRKNVKQHCSIYIGRNHHCFDLNDNLEFEFEDLPKNLYEWDEEHFLYYFFKKDQ